MMRSLLAAVAAALLLAPSAQAAGTVTVDITGPGTVAGSGIDCGREANGTPGGGAQNPTDCTETVGGSSVTLVATPAAGFTAFLPGDCTPSGGGSYSCPVIGDRTIGVVFDDTTSPTVALTTPAPGVEWGPDELAQLAATASDDQTSIANVRFEVDDVQVAPSDDTAPYEGVVDTQSLSHGVHKVEAIATDGDGNTAIAARNVVVDRLPPAFVLTGPEEGAAISVQTLDIGYTADEPVTVTCALDGGAPFSPCDGAALGEGAHTLVVQAADSHGSATSVQRAFVVDRSGPQVAFTGGPADFDTIRPSDVTFAWSISDASQTSATCSLGGAAAQACTSPVTYAGLGLGDHVMTLTVVDAAGNTTTRERHFTLSRTAGVDGGVARLSYDGSLSARKIKRRLKVGFFVPGAGRLVVDLLRKGERKARVRATATGKARGKLTLKPATRVRRGRYVVRLRFIATGGSRQTARLKLRVRR